MSLDAEKIGTSLARKMIQYQAKSTKHALRIIDQSKKSPEDQMTDVMNLCSANWKYVDRSIPPKIKKDESAFLEVMYDIGSKCAWTLIESELYPKRRSKNY